MRRKIQMPLKNRRIYLDNASTTKPYPELIELYKRISDDYFANPSSIHFEGQKAHDLLEKSRGVILDALHLEKEHEVIFTSGATESINLGIKGYCLQNKNRGKHIISSAIEHPAVKESIQQLVDCFDFEAIFLPVDKNGKVSLDDLKAAIREDTILVSIMAVNNEIGSINPIEDIAKLLKDYPKIVFHVDATQAIGKINLNYQDVDMISFSGHKIHGLHSSGALIKKKKITLLPINSGGGQENGFRSGTNDLPLAVTLAKAVKLEQDKIDENKRDLSAKSAYLLEYLNNHKDLYHLNSTGENPFIVNFSLKTKKASVVVEALSNRGIMVSSISACHSRKEAISDTVFELTKDVNLAHNTVRVSFDSNNTLEEVKILVEELDNIIKEIKQ